MLFEFISKFGFANTEQIHKYIGGSLGSVKARLSLLSANGYLKTHRIFYDRLASYTVTRKANVTGLGLVTEINLGGYLHDEMVLDVFLKLRDRFIDYTTERMIRAERGISKTGRIPDLIGELQDGVVALEIDRTDKSLDRLQGIINTYKVDYEYDEVWFICRNSFIYNNLERTIKGDEKFKLFMLEDILSGKELVYQYKEPKSTSREIKRREEILARYGWQPEVEQEVQMAEVKQEIKEEKQEVKIEKEEKKPRGFGGFIFKD
jgi:hypothetical protein